VLLVLGARDQPTDGVYDYGHELAKALRARQHEIQVVETEWSREGWVGALLKLRRTLKDGEEVLLQYTHLAWSRRGFPLMALALGAVLRSRTDRLYLVVHDPLPFPGTRVRDGLRRQAQVLVLKGLARLARAVVVTIPPDSIPWMSNALRSRAICIPVGPNVGPADAARPSRPASPFTIAVFGVTGGAEREMKEIAAVATRVSEAQGEIVLALLGRGSQEAEAPIRHALRNPRVKLCVTGVVSASEISRQLSQADVLLFVRGPVSSRRGTAVTAIAHCLPIAGYHGSETGLPATDAGLALVPEHDVTALADAVIRLANDSHWRDSLRERSRLAYQEHFCWGRIADRYEEVLRSTA
jgi:glycosyltransferase involved in cell wall biosynthesis